MLEYKVIPFISSIKEGEAAEDAARQLQRAITKNATDGWELHQVANVNLEVRPGCLWALLGHRSTVMEYNQLVFKREREG